MRRSVLPIILCFLLGAVLGAVLLFLTLTQGWLPNTRVTIVTRTATSSVSTMADPYKAAEDSSPEALTGNEPLITRAIEVAQFIRDRNWSALAGAIHPEKGVRFTPYSWVEPNTDMTFTPEEVAAFGSDSASYMWGYSDGPGEPMYMTPEEYFVRFVFNADYTQAPCLSVNRIMASGNALENVADAYPDGRFVEFYYSGLDPVNEGFDWCALKLVFEAYGNQLMLVGVIHSEWTI